jgi:hypothetical protein
MFYVYYFRFFAGKAVTRTRQVDSNLSTTFCIMVYIKKFKMAVFQMKITIITAWYFFI